MVDDAVLILHGAAPAWFSQASAPAAEAIGDDWRRLDAVVRLLWPALSMDELSVHYRAGRLDGLSSDECVDFLYALWSANDKRNRTEKLLRSDR